MIWNRGIAILVTIFFTNRNNWTKFKDKGTNNK